MAFARRKKHIKSRSSLDSLLYLGSLSNLQHRAAFDDNWISAVSGTDLDL